MADEQKRLERAGRRLRALRLNRGITCRDAARKMGVAEATLRKMEQGISNPHVRTQVAAARFYEVEPSTVWFDEAVTA